MALRVEDLEDQSKYRQILKIPYDELVSFVLEYIRRKSGLMIFFWSVCLIFLGIAVTVRINISGYFQLKNIFFHTFLGLVIFPVLYVPAHELLHIIPYYLTGARKIRIGMDLRQYMFYVTAHRHVATKLQFRFVAWVPFLLTSIALIYLVLNLPGLWKWSFSLFLFVHTTMCAGDFAMLNYYWINRKKKLYTWDDADEKMAYFYEEI
jgi:Putative zincin peptidase